MKDADPLMAGATVGQTFTAATGTFTEVPDALRAEDRGHARTPRSPTRPAASSASAGSSDTTVLDQTFNDVDLVGQSLSIGNFVNSSPIGR